MKAKKGLLFTMILLCFSFSLLIISAAANDASFSTPEAAADYVRESMVNRTESFAFQYQTAPGEIADANSTTIRSYFESLMNDIFERTFRHTGIGKEGDYLKRHMNEYSYAFDASYDSGTNTVSYTVQIEASYYTTTQQEAAVTERINDIIPSLALSGKSDYEKAKTIYDYICQNVAYDYAHLEDESYLLKYSAYAALINGTSVCQGYANLLYRLLLTAGIDSRIITGTADGDVNTSSDNRHAWNLIKLNDRYYCADATWDSPAASGSYFLRAGTNFDDHHPDEEFLTEAFRAAYPISNIRYVEYLADRETWLTYSSNVFSGGSGTEQDPYLIGSPEELALASKLINGGSAYNAHFKLIRNIDLAGHCWVPISLTDPIITRFQGSFDGSSLTIRNMTINDPFDGLADDQYYGLFGLNAGTIKNVILEDPVIAIDSTNVGWQIDNGMGTCLAIGGICGDSSYSSTIENCIVKNITIEVSSKMSLDVGGLCGSINYATVRDCYAIGSIHAVAARAVWCGGFCGHISNETLCTNCGFIGDVSSENIELTGLESDGFSYVHFVGGFVGGLGRANSNITVSNCFAQATVSAVSETSPIDAGGFSGATENVYGDVHYSNLICDSTCTVSDKYGEYTSTRFTNSELGRFADSADTFCFENLVSIQDDEMTVFNKLSKEEDAVTDTLSMDSADAAQILQNIGSDAWAVQTDPFEITVTKLSCYLSGTDHIETIDPAVSATCHSSGKTQGVYCSKCGSVIVASITIPPLAHTVVIDSAIPATCTSSGKTEGKHCSVCNKVLTEQTVVPAKGHVDSNNDGVCDRCKTRLTPDDSSDQPSGDVCSYCHKVHGNSFGQRFLAFFHRVLYFLLHLFRLR